MWEMTSCLLRLPYLLALGVCRIVFKKVHGPNFLGLWARNSFVLGYFVPFKSDLDLTLHLSTSPDSTAIRRHNMTYHILKLLFPFLGEINTVADESLSDSVQFLNHFELMRDPRLHSLISARTPVPIASRSAAVCFLLRMLESDYRNLTHRPQSRLKKWTHHRSAISDSLKIVDLPQLSPEDMLEGIYRIILVLSDNSFLTSAKEAQTWLHLYFQCRLKGIPLSELEPLFRSRSWLPIFLPHRAMMFQLKYQVANTLYQEILHHQLIWEVNGIRSQTPFHFTEQHLENQEKTVKEFLSTWKIHPAYRKKTCDAILGRSVGEFPSQNEIDLQV